VIDLADEPDLGYYFHPSDTADHPGHPRLDIIIKATPTERHFDPQKVRLFVSARHGIKQLVVHHPWTLKTEHRVSPGLIVITDRKGKRVEAYSFGGDLVIVSDKDQTVCALTSPAPIFPLFTTHDLPMWLVCEFEILLAEQEADWDPRHPHDFEDHAAAVDPFLLYASCLQALRDKGANLQAEISGLDHQGYQFVKTEIERLQREGKWPLLLPTLDQLL
jgi:hypothetical protein